MSSLERVAARAEIGLDGEEFATTVAAERFAGRATLPPFVSRLAGGALMIVFFDITVARTISLAVGTWQFPALAPAQEQACTGGANHGLAASVNAMNRSFSICAPRCALPVRDGPALL